MKVKVTQEDTLHSKMFFYHIYIINCYCPLALLARHIRDKAQPIKVDPLWPGKIHNGLVQFQNCLDKPRSQG